jgi:hypothetical protein
MINEVTGSSPWAVCCSVCHLGGESRCDSGSSCAAGPFQAVQDKVSRTRGRGRNRAAGRAHGQLHDVGVILGGGPRQDHLGKPFVPSFWTAGSSPAARARRCS